MAIPHLKVWTYDDYAALPADGKRYEVIEGELIELPAPRMRHQMIIVNIAALLWAYVKANGLGTVSVAPTDVVLAPTLVVQPDVLFISDANAGVLTDLNVQGPPDLCIEILSPGTRTRDLGQKRDLYAQFGVREYWIVDPDATRVTVFTRDGNGYSMFSEATGDTSVRSQALPGFTITARELFPSA